MLLHNPRNSITSATQAGSNLFSTVEKRGGVAAVLLPALESLLPPSHFTCFFIVHFEEQLQIRGCLVLKKWEFRVITSGHGKKYVREAISKEALSVCPARALHAPVLTVGQNHVYAILDGRNFHSGDIFHIRQTSQHVTFLVFFNSMN